MSSIKGPKPPTAVVTPVVVIEEVEEKEETMVVSETIVGDKTSSVNIE